MSCYNIDMICDKLENLNRYLFAEMTDFMMRYIDSLDLDSYVSERVYIDENIRITKSEYDTKPFEETRSETHDRIIDVVILLEGEEYIYTGFRDDYVPVSEYDYERDITYYENKKEDIRLHMKPGIFAIFTPNDVHHPYCMIESPGHVKKITFKIRRNLFIY